MKRCRLPVSLAESQSTKSRTNGSSLGATGRMVLTTTKLSRYQPVNMGDNESSFESKPPGPKTVMFELKVTSPCAFGAACLVFCQFESVRISPCCGRSFHRLSPLLKRTPACLPVDYAMFKKPPPSSVYVTPTVCKYSSITLIAFKPAQWLVHPRHPPSSLIAHLSRPPPFNEPEHTFVALTVLKQT